MTFLVWVYTSQDLAQTKQNFGCLHDRVTVIFRNSVYTVYTTAYTVYTVY